MAFFQGRIVKMANLKSVFYVTVGLALKGKEKVEKVAKKFVKENKIEEKEGKKFVDNAIKHAEETKKELAKKITETVKSTIKKMGLITHKEARKIAQRFTGDKVNFKKSKIKSRVKK
jgi:polyhydroxyalkanoate synthesis regulator phasin